MNLNRRNFLIGGAAFGAFGGCRAFSRNVRADGGNPVMRFGVVSDIHIDGLPGDRGHVGDAAVFIKALKWFRDQGVDAVMVAGDMATWGLTEELEAVAAAWYSVFPNDRAPDGRKVERIFVYGNHDWEGWRYGNKGERIYPDKDELNRHLLQPRYAAEWERVFHEPYTPIYRKEVKGFSFIGSHWDRTNRKDDFHRIRQFMQENGSTFDPTLPFFYVQHPHPKGTCYGSWAWGRDTGIVTETLSKYPQAVAFSGHSHYSLTDERSIWQGAFTSIGASSLRYSGEPDDAFPKRGFENASAPSPEAERWNALKVMSRMNGSDGRQGMLVSVYDDCIEYDRRDFVNDLSLGDAWVQPLLAAEGRPFAFAEHAKSFAAPEFPEGARLKMRTTKAKTRGSSKVKGVMKEAIELTIPAVIPAKNARSFVFEVVAKSDAGSATWHLLAKGYNKPLTHADTKQPLVCRIPKDEVPAGEAVFTVTPVSCFGKRGAALSVCAKA